MNDPRNTNAYVASARTYSIALLATAFLTFDLATYHVKRDGARSQLRRLVNSVLFHQAMSDWDVRPFPKYSSDETWTIREDNDDAILVQRSGDVLGFRNVQLIAHGNKQFGRILLEKIEIKYASSLGLVEFERDTFLSAVSEIQPDADKRSIIKIAADLQAERDYNNIYTTAEGIENKIHQMKVTIPGVGLIWDSSRAIWTLGLIGFFMLTLVRNRLRYVCGLETHEPWLVLNSSVPSEKLVSALWILCVLLSPWLIGTSLLASTTAQIRFHSSTSSLSQDLFVFLLVICFELWGGWQAWNIVAMVLRQRALYHPQAVQ